MEENNGMQSSSRYGFTTATTDTTTTRRTTQAAAAAAAAAVASTRLSLETTTDTGTTNTNTSSTTSTTSHDGGHHDFQDKQHVMMGLNIAGVAATCLTTIFGLFHVDVFLRAYELPLPVYSAGSVIFAIVNTANDVAGAWLVDHVATTMPRSDLVGISGCVFCLAFLTPFFRYSSSSSVMQGGAHFVASMSAYDTLYSFTAILMGSVVTDNHSMTDKARVQYMASSKVLNLVASLVVARIGLSLFDVTNLRPFRSFLVVLASAVGVLFVTAQAMILGMTRANTTCREFLGVLLRPFQRARLRLGLDSDKNNYNYKPAHQQQQSLQYGGESSSSTSSKRKLRWRQVVKDFRGHSNFWAWIGMEMLLEAQNTFVTSFLKTFVDQLVLEVGVSRVTCDWLLSMIRPLTQVVSIFAYIPIRRFGYPRVYTILFGVNMILSLTLLIMADETSTTWIIFFLCTYPVVTGAVMSAGFHLAMSDMVLESKRKHALEGRHDAPSLAGIFMGANALVCKPMESLLPVITATVLHRSKEYESKKNLFYLLVLPPLFCSCLQLLSWSRFDLHSKLTDKMRDELKKLHSRSESDIELVVGRG
jgi:hypothetical protein